MKQKFQEINRILQEAKAAQLSLESEFLQAVGYNIKSKRIVKGLTQNELSAKLPFGRTSLTNIEAGRQDTTITNILLIAMALDCEPKELFEF